VSKQVKSFVGKQFSQAYYNWLENSIAKAKVNGDTIGLKSLQEVKNLYFLDYMADWFDECAIIVSNMVSEVKP
jgi:F0F1-type ATP synthase gamma subunit